jgi:hypothetical protein
MIASTDGDESAGSDSKIRISIQKSLRNLTRGSATAVSPRGLPLNAGAHSPDEHSRDKIGWLQTSLGDSSPRVWPSLDGLGSGLHLKDNFSASQMSRTDSFAPDGAAHPRLLLERAIIARVTMQTWCELRRAASMPGFVTMPIPEPLQELQVCAHAFATCLIGRAARSVGGLQGGSGVTGSAHGKLGRGYAGRDA